MDEIFSLALSWERRHLATTFPLRLEDVWELPSAGLRSTALAVGDITEYVSERSQATRSATLSEPTHPVIPSRLGSLAVDPPTDTRLTPGFQAGKRPQRRLFTAKWYAPPHGNAAYLLALAEAEGVALLQRRLRSLPPMV